MFLLVFAFASLASIGVQNPPPAQPAPGQQSASPVVVAGDAAVVLNYIRADKASDFEAVMAKVKQALETSALPERKQQAAGWKVFKSAEPVGEGQVLYLWVIDPAAKGADYSVPRILSEAFPADARRLYEQFEKAYARGKLKIDGKLVLSMADRQP